MGGKEEISASPVPSPLLLHLPIAIGTSSSPPSFSDKAVTNIDVLRGLPTG